MTQPPQGPWYPGPEDRRPGGPQGPLPPPVPRPLPGPWQYPAPQQGQHAAARPAHSRGPIIAICLGVVATLVLCAVVVVSLLGGSKDQVAGTGYGDYPKATGAPPVETSSSTATSAAPSPSISSGPPTYRSPETRPSDTGPRKIFTLADHPMLQNPDAGLKNRACDLPQWRSDPASAQAFFTAAGQCLDAAWGPFLEHYNLPFTSPNLHFPSGASFQTECGTIQVGIATAAYYCENNLYVPFAGLQTDQYGDNPGVYLALFAHEYGHHVQEVSGLMDAAWEKIYEAGPNSQQGLEMSRRKELQAQCFSGMFLGAHVDQGGTITRDMYNKAWDDQETRGDDTSGTRDHGSNAHYAGWWRAGAKENRIVDCNTFAAASADVS
ncbi:neutral zinc metallopeptidase [Amycolatopsis palatopharyngis]|uniref:neutral zinc metallopeptidase n=1 Tax=Amycolatopsis palatopharyngis TaxID=187982 RepID=UPI000E27F1AF|nr:neutral zinc metallopeptidase [Amycolatopsis palatopharyngis]